MKICRSSWSLSLRTAAVACACSRTKRIWLRSEQWYMWWSHYPLPKFYVLTFTPLFQRSRPTRRARCRSATSRWRDYLASSLNKRQLWAARFYQSRTIPAGLTAQPSLSIFSCLWVTYVELLSPLSSPFTHALYEQLATFDHPWAVHRTAIRHTGC